MDDVYKRFSRCKIWILSLVMVIIVIFLNIIFDHNNTYVLLISSILVSIFASLLVGVYFQFVLKDEISKEHLKIIEYKDEFNKSGILKYYSSFKDCIEDLRYDIRKSKELTIFVTYGNTIFNTLSEEITFFLSKPSTSLKVFFMDKENPFKKGYSNLWGYTEEKFSNKISESIDLFKNKKKELKNRNALNGQLEIFLLKKYPIHYSFYFCDDILYFVPSKHYESKEFVPLTIKAQKTAYTGALYNKIKDDLDFILKAKDGIIKFEEWE